MNSKFKPPHFFIMLTVAAYILPAQLYAKTFSRKIAAISLSSKIDLLLPDQAIHMGTFPVKSGYNLRKNGLPLFDGNKLYVAKRCSLENQFKENSLRLNYWTGQFHKEEKPDQVHPTQEVLKNAITDTLKIHTL